jgi:hypothetical protein
MALSNKYLNEALENAIQQRQYYFELYHKADGVVQFLEQAQVKQDIDEPTEEEGE